MKPAELLAKIRAKKPAAPAPEAPAAAPAAEAEAAPAQPRRVKLHAAPEPVSREEFDSLAAQLESFKTIATLAVAATGFAMAGPTGLPDSNLRRRLGLLAAVTDLGTKERAQLQDFFRRLATLDRIESARAMEEAARRRLPPTFETCRVPSSWRG